MRKRKIVGVQVHHSVSLNDAHRGLVNGAMGLSGAIASTGDPALVELHERAQQLVRDVGKAEREASARLQQFYEDDPERFKRCRDGYIPWPDETLMGFEARCTCSDICQIHDRGRTEPGWVCKCEQCPAHPDVERQAA